MKKLFLLIIIFLSAGVAAKAQKVKVLDRSDLQPIGQVNISNLSRSLLVVTNLSGVADLSGFNATDTLVFSHVAYSVVKTTKSALAQSNNTIYLTENVISLDEFVFSANKTEEKRSDLPYVIEVIQAKDVAFNNPQTTAIMLEQTGNVFVQQSQLGGGSPVIRGFEANRVELVLDGVRMNNAIYRAGHLQSIITIDPMMLSSTEVIYGPGSVIYGSDALGGVISFKTKDPVLANGKTPLIFGQGIARFSSANLEKTIGFNLNIGLKKWGFFTAFSYSNFDDLREGRTQNPFYGTFGERPYYAERINGQDTMIANDKPWIQVPSGYSQYNLLQKVQFRPSERLKFTLNFQYSNSTDIPRYDRLTEMDGSTGHLKYAEWYYGPQQRVFVSLKTDLTQKNVMYDNGSVILTWQNVSEDRINRRFNKSTKKNNLETANVYALNGDFTKLLGSKDALRYGVEFIFNDVNSEAYNLNIKTGDITYDLATRYPDEKAQMFSAAAYLSNNWKINRVLNFSQGLRFNYVSLNTVYSDTMMKITGFPFSSEISQSNPALNGYLGLTVTPEHDWKFGFVASSGFRAPNIDDISKLNDSNSQDKLLVVPNPDLKPEYAYNIELSAGKTFLKKFRIEASAYYTWLTNAIVMAPFQYNGQDSIIWEGEMVQVQSNTNAGDAYVYGVQGSLLAQITTGFSITSSLTYTCGRVSTNDEPLDHIPPVFGMTSFNLEVKKFKGSFYLDYNGWKRIEDYSPSGEDNEAYATEYGMPAWYTVNLKLSYQFNRYLNVEAGCENILDQNYRKFASGISSPGRNFIVALRGTF